MLAQSKPFCELLAQAKIYIPQSMFLCEEIDSTFGINGLGALLQMINIPNGNTKPWGTLEGCIAAESQIYVNPYEIGNFSGRWAVAKIVDKFSLEDNNDPEPHFARRLVKDTNPKTRMQSGISVIPAIPGLDFIIGYINNAIDPQDQVPKFIFTLTDLGSLIGNTQCGYF